MRALGKLLTSLGSAGSKEAAKAALPGAALNLAAGTVLSGPVAGAAYAAGDFLLNYPLIRAAKKYFPGAPATMTYKSKAGEQIVKQITQPSTVENIANVAGSLASMPLVDYITRGSLIQQANTVEPTAISQEQQIYQQSIQRQQVNNLQQQALAPGTQFQMQGIEQTFQYPGMTLPPDVLRQLQAQG
jgi:hypothetical protein